MQVREASIELTEKLREKLNEGNDFQILYNKTIIYKTDKQILRQRFVENNFFFSHNVYSAG